jgi:RNA polymerase sigma-70 factor (ECF subfamily)
MEVVKRKMAAEIAYIILTGAQEIPTEDCAEGNADYFAVLVARACAGDEFAFEQIMLATEQRVVSIAWRILGNREDAREATQDVYLRVFKYLARYRANEDFRAWLYRITINVCHDFARKRRSTAAENLDGVQVELEGVAFDFVRQRANPEGLVLQEQQLALIRDALQSLPAKERAALVLRDLEGFSTEEVAKALGSRPVTVRSQVSAARAKIKTYCDRISRGKGQLR